MGLGDLVNSIGDGAEHLAEGAEHLAGSTVEGLADGAGDALNAVGLHSAAQGVEHFGDGIADDLGAAVAEAQLGESDDPKDLVHGDAGEITKTADSLRKFKSGFEDAYQALSQLETDDWQGQAAEAFHTKYLEHPKRWSDAAEACGQAATALDTYAQTVTWAQGQAKQAVEDYQAAKQATDAHNKQVDQYNQAAEGYNYLVSHHDSLPAGATKPVPPPSEDPGAAGRPQAQQLLNAARKQRDQAADAAARAISAAMALAPKEPSFLQRMYNDGHDLVQDAPTELLHFSGGIVKGAVGIVNFARTLNPLDPYNLTHPATYLDGLSTTAAGLVHAANNPTVLLKSLVGSGWSTDPMQALGNLVPNIALAVATDGGGTAADAAADVGERAGVGAGEDAGENAAGQAAREDPVAPHDGDASTDCGDPIDVATGRMTLRQTDLSLPGVLPLAFERAHDSGRRSGRWMGPSWACTLDQRLEIDGEGVVFVRADGVRLVYPHPDERGVPVLPDLGAPWPLIRTAEGYQVADPDTGRIWQFATATPASAPAPAPALARLVEISDRIGHRIEFAYGEHGTPTEIRHSGGYRVQLTVEHGRITALHLADAGPDGEPVEVIRYGYTDGHLTEITDSSGAPLRFAYDTRGRIVSWTDRNHSTYHYAYDEADRCTAQGGQAGHLHYRYTYDRTDPATGLRVTGATDSLGATTRYLINEHLQVVAETDALGNTTRTLRDRHDRVTEHIDALGNATAYAYDESGNLARVTRADGTTHLFEHDCLGLPTVLTAPDGTSIRRTYDDAGLLVSTTDQTGATERYTHDDHGHLATVTDPLGQVTRVRCDAAGLPIEVTDPTGATTHYRRDAFGRVTATTDPVGGVLRQEWTVEGRPARRTTPDGASETWTWDGEGNLLTHTDPAGATTSYEYTHFDLLSTRTDPDGTRHTFTYDRDPAGHLTHSQNALGQQIHYTYDALGRPVSKSADGTETTYAYDTSGRLLRAANPDGELARTYDPAGRLLTETVNGRTLTLAYDEAGQLTQRTTPSGAVSAWAWDAAGRPTRLTASGRTLAFGYDPAGRETTRRLGDAATLTQTWDPAHRLTAQLLHTGPAADGALLQHRAYTYRTDAHLAAVDDHLTGRRAFDLDPAGRVTAVHHDRRPEAYAYDPAGNLTDASWPATAHSADATGDRDYTGTLIRRAGKVRYEHDAAGRLTLRQHTRLSRKPDTWRYTWDADNRLTHVTTPDGHTWRYRYDPLGRRIAKQRLADDGTTVLEQIDFTWHHTTLAEQTTHAPTLPGPHTLTWDHSADGLTPLAQTEHLTPAADDQTATDSRFFAIVTDLIGTPAELIDEHGTLAWHTRTALWGETTWPKHSETYTPLRFPGQYFDPETRLHYNLNRYYDPETARYTSPDPLGLAPAPNPHTYVHNPTAWTDPLGLAPCAESIQKMKDSAYGQFKQTPYTNAGRALTKKINRADEGPAWEHLRPSPANEAGWNTSARSFLEDLFSNSETQYGIERGRIAGVYHDLHTFRLNGIGARFDMDNNFVGFVT